MEILTSSHKSHTFSHGNRCGHKKDSLRDLTFPQENSRPWLIKESMRLVRKKFFYEPQRKELPAKRSDGREAIGQFLLKCLYNFELSTQTVCLNDITFKRPTLENLTSDSKDTGLSISRAKRSQIKAVNAEFMEVIRSSEEKEGKYKSDPSFRKFTPKFFLFLDSDLAMSYYTQIHRKTMKIEKRKIKIYGQEKNAKKLQILIQSGYILNQKSLSPKIQRYKNTKNKISNEEKNKIRNEYFRLLKIKFSQLSEEVIISLVNKTSIENIQKSLADNRNFTEPPD